MNGTQTLSRALDILFALAESNGTLSVTEIADKAGLPESTTYRFLQTLEQNGIVERKGKRQIGLGLRILDLARSLTQQTYRELLSLALPIMQELTEKTHETSLLFIRSGINAICIQHVKSRELIQFVIEDGRSLPLHLGASGKVILAYENQKFQEKFIKDIEAEGYTGSPSDLREELASIRSKGVAVTHGEVDSDVFAIAAPILDSYNMVVASISIAGPNFRFVKDSDNEGLVWHAAQQLSRKFGMQASENSEPI
jgi:DNA-binding IclR family transcriptional regulator